jgi:hypothetical protein
MLKTVILCCLIIQTFAGAFGQEKSWIEVEDKSGGPFPGMVREYSLKIFKSGKISCRSSLTDGKQRRSSEKASRISKIQLSLLNEITASDDFKAVPSELPAYRGIDYFSTKTFLINSDIGTKKIVVQNYIPTIAPRAYPVRFRRFTSILSKLKATSFKDAAEPWQACFDEDNEEPSKASKPSK